MPSYYLNQICLKLLIKLGSPGHKSITICWTTVQVMACRLLGGPINADISIIPYTPFYNKMSFEVQSWSFQSEKCKCKCPKSKCYQFLQLLVNDDWNNDKSLLVWVMVWCQWVSKRIPHQCSLRYLKSYGVTRLRWPESSWWTLVQLLACRLLRAKPLIKSMLACKA